MVLIILKCWFRLGIQQGVCCGVENMAPALYGMYALDPKEVDCRLNGERVRMELDVGPCGLYCGQRKTWLKATYVTQF